MLKVKSVAGGGRARKFDAMRLVRGGRFRMGSETFYPDEGPIRTAEVGDFWIDETPVTNAQFARFVAETGYTTFAEIPPDPRDYPGMPQQMAHAGSSVFTPPDGPVDVAEGDDAPPWWAYVFGADWRHPLGPHSDIEGRGDHPVVHIVAADAEAYSAWAGKALPTEAEWEYAARGGLHDAAYAWGDSLEPDGRPMAKVWQGEFPWRNTAAAGLERTAPVRSYPANGFGLYDMIGNVWEWTSDWYASEPVAASPCCGGSARAAMTGSCDPRSPIGGIPRRVLKGGSHLCAPNYCQRYRPAARWAQSVDTSTSHVGFRCIVRR
jgi:formylglycine-generating enzyme required for sulfatase activity